MATPTFELIDTTTLTSDVSSYTASGIPNTYRDLVVIISDLNMSATGNIVFYYNNDSSTTYVGVVGGASGSSYHGASNNTNGIDPVYWLSGGTSSYFTIEHNILDYAQSSKHKHSLTRTGSKDNLIEFRSDAWPSYSAITSFTVQGLTANIRNATISIYGVL